MSWFFIALLGYFLLAVVFVLDKLILTENVSKPSVYTFYSTIFMFGALLAYPFGVQLLSGFDWVWALFSGLAFGFGLWTMFIAVEASEASHINPFIGAMVTIATFGLSSLLLGESLTTMQFYGMLLLVVASLILSFEKTKEYSGVHPGYIWGASSGILFGFSHVTAKYVYETYDFLTGLVWTRSFVGIVGLITLCIPAVWSVVKSVKQKKTEAQKKKNWQTFGIVTIDKVLGVVGVVLIQYASAVGMVTPVFAMTGVQFVLMFVMIYALTKWAPKLFQEYFTRRELIVQSVAILLVVIGSALFVI